MSAQLCHVQHNLKTFALTLLGGYAEVWSWNHCGEHCGLEIITIYSNPSKRTFKA